jgi:hypothetical protein
MIRFLANNLVETAQLTASTSNAQFPVSNIQDDFRTRVWRSTSNSDSIVFDLGSTEPVDYVGIVDNWQNGFGVSTITIEANATDSWGAPAFSTSLTFDSQFGVGVKSITEQNYRYWRFVFTSTLGYCEVANLFIGKATVIDTNGIDYRWSYKNRDVKKYSSTRYGQEYIDDITQRKELNGLKIKVMNTTELDKMFEVFDNRRTVKPLFVEFCDPSSTLLNNINRLNGLYKFTSEPSFPNVTAGYWETSFSLREQK